MQSSHTDLLSKTFTEQQLLKPSDEEVAAKADETRGALEALLQVRTPNITPDFGYCDAADAAGKDGGGAGEGAGGGQ